MNVRAFTPDEVEDGYLNDLLKYLMDHNDKNRERYYDIHITTDGFCQIVEWTDINYERDYEEGRFRYVDCDEVVMKEVEMPDNSIVYAHDEDEAKELIDDFLKENPNYEKNEYGR